MEPISWAMVFLPCSEAIVQLRNFLVALMFSESAYLFKHSYCVATGRQSLLLLVGQTHVDGYHTDLVGIHLSILRISPSPSAVLIECSIPQGKLRVRIIGALAASRGGKVLTTVCTFASAR